MFTTILEAKHFTGIILIETTHFTVFGNVLYGVWLFLPLIKTAKSKWVLYKASKAEQRTHCL